MKFAMLLTATALAFVAPAANAAVTINIVQQGGSVVATTSGSLNTTGFVFGAQGTNTIYVRGSAFFFTGQGGVTVNGYNGLTGPTFGDTLMSGASSSTGDAFGFNLNNNRLFLPLNYVSGAALNATTTFDFKTIQSLELNVGTYVYTIGNETITLNIGQAATPAVPEPATWAMMLIGFGLMGGALRSRAKVGARIRFA